METVLVTGATGFLGYHLVNHLVQSHRYEVHCYRRLNSNIERFSEDVLKQIKWYETESLEKPFKETKKINHVIHLATCYGRLGEKLSTLLETNIFFPVSLFEFTCFYGSDSFFNIGTLLPKDISRYAKSKSQLSEWLKTLHTPESQTKLFDLQLEHMYGPFDEDSRFVKMIIKKCLKNEPIPLTDGEQERDFVYVGDVVSAIAFLLQKTQKFTGVNCMQIGTGVTTSIRELVNKIQEITKSTSKLEFGRLPRRHTEPARLIADISALKALGWSPQYKLSDGLEKTIAQET